MHIDDLKSAYRKSESIHLLVSDVLDNLDEKTQIKYNKKKKAVVFVAVLLTVLFVLSTTVVAAKTDFFGLYSNKKGKYGLDVGISESNKTDSNKPDKVKLQLDYIPDGYKPTDDSLKYTYNGEAVTDKWSFSFDIEKSLNFEYKGTHIVDSSVITHNGYKIVLMTRQFEYDSDKDYIAIKYFDDMGYVVICYCTQYDELERIIKGTNLLKDSSLDVTQPQKPYVEDNNDYAFSTIDVFKPLCVGESIDFSDNILNRMNDDCFSVKVKSVKKKNNFSGLDKKHIVYDTAYSNYFTDDGNWIGTYTRTTRDNGDGINSLDKTWETQMNRSFYLVTLEVTANRDNEHFSLSSIGARTIDYSSSNQYKYSDRFGNVDMFYLEPMENHILTLETKKDQTVTIVVGIAVDEDMEDTACLTLRKRYIDIDKTAQTAKETVEYNFVRLKEEVAYD